MYVPPVNAGSVLGSHDVLRVTFAEEPHWFVPDDVASANLRAEVSNLIASMESGGFALAPASDVSVPPGALAWTIDFVPVGAVTVGQAVTQLDDALRTLFTSNGYVARVEKLAGGAGGQLDAGTQRGDTSLTLEQQLQQNELGKQLASIFGKATIGLAVLGGAALLLVYAPQVKAAVSRVRR
jgi:hypothetical protein